MNYSLLADCPLFNKLSGADIEDILKAIPFRTRKYPAGSMIAQSGEVVISLMIVLSGTVKGEMTDYSGRVIKIEDIPAPGALASAFLFGNRNRYPVNVVSVSDADIMIIDKSEFLRLLMRNDQILINFLDMVSNRSQFLSEKIKFLNFKTIKAKLAQYLLKIAGDQKSSFRLDKTQNDLADYFGVARPSVARAIKELEENGYIKADGKQVRIIDREGLVKLTSIFE
jgi:CRP/FNR family transcriptional regulator, dissimilatory nitrate respiration regulator